MQISLGESICQEFSDMVYVGYKFIESERRLSDEIEEIKCCINVEHLPDLMDRMGEIGYAMVQVQKDRSLKKCFVWFEPCSWLQSFEAEDEDDDDFFEYP